MNKEYITQAEAVTADNSRQKSIVRTSVIGILTNVVLAAFKALVGLLSNSIAIVLDAVNNLSDAASSVITIVGTKLAAKAPDRKHPFGHGRVEYLSAMIIAIIVLYAGITSLIESVKKIITPETPDYQWYSLVIVGVAVVVKIILGRYVKKMGVKNNSDSLINSGEDATLDAIISASTLVAAVIFLLSGLSLEAYLGAIISLIIIKSGIDMLRNTISSILGERADAQLVRDIKETVCSFPGVSGAYDLVLNNYGPNEFIGSVHIEVPDSYTANQLDDLLRQIQVCVYRKHHVILSAIGVYSVNTRDEEAVRMRETVRQIVMSHEYVLQMHGFYLDKDRKYMRFDIIISFDAGNRSEVFAQAVRDVQEHFPEYEVAAAMDTDFSEE